MGLLSFAVKTSVFSGITYYTIQQGLWGTPNESEQFYAKIHNTVTPLIKKNVSDDLVKDIPTLPKPADIKNYVACYWNCGVKVSIKWLSELPTHISNGINSLQKQIENVSTVPDAKDQKS